MKALRNGMLTIAALALAGIFTGTANAQAKAAGSFTLPFEAKWGNAVLPPGNYTFSVHSANSARDRKSTRLNSSHGYISYAVFCLKKKNADDIRYPRHVIYEYREIRFCIHSLYRAGH